MEWHEQALSLFQRYLLTEHQCTLPSQITEMQVRGWFTTLPLLPTTKGTLRSPNTIESYARSARAFCQWLVRHHNLLATPFAHLALPPVETHLPLPLQPEEWEQLLLACHCPKETGTLADQAAARNCALLWVLFETGMQVTEVCQLRLGDVDREQRVFSVRGKGSKARQLMLGSEGRHHLLMYLEHYWLGMVTNKEQRGGMEGPLFLSESGGLLTKSGVNLLFDRLRKRAGITGKEVTASLLRKSFAVRYLQTGGDRGTLQELLGQRNGALSKYSLAMGAEAIDNHRVEEC